MDEQPSPENNPQAADRGLSSVAKSGPKISDFAWGIGALALVAGILWMNYGDRFTSSKEQNDITAQQEDQYRIIAAGRDPVIPERELDPPAPQHEQAETLDPMLLQYQLRLQELERKRAEAEQKHAEARKRSPMMVYSKGGARANPATNGGNDIFAGGNNSALSGLSGGSSAPEGFVDGNQRSHVETVRAGRLSNQDYMIAQGTSIRGILETAIHSDLAGYIRAIVSEDIYSFDGTRVLVPRGSKIIGRYQSGIKQTQSRLFVVWQRIIRPDGIDIMVDSPGTDSLGRAGLGGDVDTHFMERFGSAILLSMIDGALQAGVNAANDNSAETVVTGSGGALNRSAEIALENSINIRPTIHVDQGTPINIFVTKDMDFSSTKPKENKFSWWK